MSDVDRPGIRLAPGQVHSVVGAIRTAPGASTTYSGEKRNCLLAVQFQSNSRG